MSLVGPRPEDPSFVELRADEYAEILRVRPGVTGLSQLAFARESEILDDDNRYEQYVERLFPQKIAIDRLYVRRRSFTYDIRILVWTAVTILLRKDVAVHRQTGRLTRRRRPTPSVEFARSTSTV
jgi:lipopolysaccharide/colanic/teichoic acid biosynthesis glycosyltransferase